MTLTVHKARETALADGRMYTMLYDVRFKLNNVISHYRDDWYWASWKYLEIEKQHIHQNNVRLLWINGMNHTQNLPHGFDLLQQSLFRDWNIINERLISCVPAFICTREAFFRGGELNINAMLKAFMLPSLFVTVTFSEWWKEFIAILQRATAGTVNPLPTDFP